MKKILKLIPILFIALMMISCSDEAQSPSLDGEPIPPDSGLFEDNGYTVYDKVIDTYEGTSNEPWVLTVGKDQIKLSVDKNSLGEIISGVEGAPLFPRGIDLPNVLEINLLNSGSIQNFLDFYCRYDCTRINDPFAMLPSETKTVTINTVAMEPESGLEPIKYDSIESVAWIMSTNSPFKVFEIRGQCEYTKADDGTLSTITLKEVPITADYLYIEVVAKKGDEPTIYTATISDFYHPTNRDEVYANATVETAEFSLKTQEDSDPSEFDWSSLELSETAQLLSSNGRYVPDETNPHYEIAIELLAEQSCTRDGKLVQLPNGVENPYKIEDTVVLTLKKDATSGNLILSQMVDSDEDGTDDEEGEIGEYTKRK